MWCVLKKSMKLKKISFLKIPYYRYVDNDNIRVCIFKKFGLWEGVRSLKETNHKSTLIEGVEKQIEPRMK